MTYRNTITSELRDIAAELVQAWAEAGNPKAAQWEPYTPPVPAVTYSTADYIAAVEAAFDAAAKAHGYDNIDRACSYAGAPNPFQAESQAFVTWRGAVWAACYAAQANPPAVQPSPEALVATLLQTHPAP